MTHACPGSFGCRVPLAVGSSWRLGWKGTGFSRPGPSWTPRGVCVCVWAHPPTLLGVHALTCVGFLRTSPCPAVWAGRCKSQAGKVFSEHPLTQPGRLRQAKAVAQRDLGVSLPGLVPSSASPSPEPVVQSRCLSASGCVACSCASCEL